MGSLVKSAYKATVRFLNRNKYIIGNKNFPTVKNEVNVHRYRLNSGKENLGDYLPCVVVDYLKNMYGIKGNAAEKTKHLFAIGSILHFCIMDATVWGSGFMNYPGKTSDVYLMRKLHKMDIRAVRGPKTRTILLDLGFNCPECYGDPAVLMPLIYSNDNICKTKEFSVIKHMSDKTKCANEINILTDDYKGFIDKMLESKLIISSSLHGIILAEAYGVPAVLYLPGDTTLSLLKYEDYYFGTGRYEFPVARTIDEALSITPCPLPDFTSMQKALIDSFPKDIWK